MFVKLLGTTFGSFLSFHALSSQVSEFYNDINVLTDKIRIKKTMLKKIVGVWLCIMHKMLKKTVRINLCYTFPCSHREIHQTRDTYSLFLPFQGPG